MTLRCADLKAENRRLREALTEIAKPASVPKDVRESGNWFALYNCWKAVCEGRRCIARDALKGKQDE